MCAANVFNERPGHPTLRAGPGFHRGRCRAFTAVALFVATSCGARTALEPAPTEVRDLHGADAALDAPADDGRGHADDGGRDPGFDAGAGDAGLDVGVDAAGDGSYDGVTPDAVEPGCASPRALAPLSTSTVTSQTPRLAWSLGDGSDGAAIEVCRDRACGAVLTTVRAAGSTVVLPTALAQGVYFWRLRGTRGAAPCSAATPAWEFFVGARSAAQNTSWGTTLDVNGDGYPDVAVGRSNFAGPTKNAYLFLGRAAGTAATSTLLTFAGDPHDEQRVPIASAGDVNGDGFGDLIVGVPNLATDAGSALVYLGGPGGLSTTPVTLSVPGARGTFGWSVASAGDVDGDGYADLLVGGDAVGARTSIFLFAGGPAGPATVGTAIDAPPGGGAAYAYLGTFVAGAGDVDGDGYADVLAGALFGLHAFVYRGGPSGLSATPILLTDPDPPDPTDPKLPDPLFGVAVAGAGDVNGDGFADVLVGAPQNGNYNGDTYLYLGGASALASPTRLVSPPTRTGAGFGWAVAAAGDVNDDGYADLLVDTEANSYLAFGGAAGPLTTWFVITAPPGENNAEGAGALAAAGDLDGDGFGEVLVGSPFSNGSIGSAFVYHGSPMGPGPAVAITNPDVPGGLFGASVF